MRPSRNEDDARKTGPPPQPLCLFCFPEDASPIGRTSYVNALPGKEENSSRGWDDARARQREAFWPRRRTEARIRRRRTREPIRSLRSLLLASVKDERLQQKTLPSLFEVLETVKDAWPSPPPRNDPSLRHDEKKSPRPPDATPKAPAMKDERVGAPLPAQLLNRRFSMPEELMRKYSVSKERTSEESETNKTMVEASSPPSSSSSSSSSGVGQEETARRMPEVETVRLQQPGEPPRRATQSDCHPQGRRVIKVKAACTCRRDKGSSTTASAKEETDESGTSESLSSSSPTQLPKLGSSSGNLSSESDRVRCTCAELTSSKETSTDLFHSGKSTLSQTVSEKTSSTQDSTASVNSVSTRGSTVTDDSASTTPEMERTSAKETTTSPDYSPKTPRGSLARKPRRRDKCVAFLRDHATTCPRHDEAKHSRNHPRGSDGRRCPVHTAREEAPPKATANAATNTEHRTEDSVTQTSAEAKNEVETRGTEDRYKWARLSQEEVYLMQQLRHRKFVESQRRLSGPLPVAPDANPLSASDAGSAYGETGAPGQTVMIPRYSALPRTLSMLVNTSSPDASLHNSDSDNQSLADSLEDQPVTHVHELYFDTKKESKPVRGDVAVTQESRLKHKGPRGRAFFVSIKDPYGEDEMLESIEKIPQPPEKIKNQIFERHLSLCAKHRHLHGAERKQNADKKRKTKNKKEDAEKTARNKKSSPNEERRGEKKTGAKKQEEGKVQRGDDDRRKKEAKDPRGRFASKIPVLVSSRSTSSSPERDPEEKEKHPRPKIRGRREKEAKEEAGKGEAAPEGKQSKPKDVEATQILEITHTGTELSLQKPQAVIHPSQVPLDGRGPRDQLTIPPLVSTVRCQPPRHTWNKPVLLSQARRSPIGKFRQRFEVIPEEKSSSLSSAEEKNGRESLPKFADASTSPHQADSPDKVRFQSYNVNEVPNLFVAKITNKHLETLPYVKKSDSQKIILFSSKGHGSNSSKGRDALIAMNREDFNRLAKGWVNFYKLSETMDNSENEDACKSNKNREGEKKGEPEASRGNAGEEPPKGRQPHLEENLRFHSSNTILASGPAKQTSLPELKPPGPKGDGRPGDDDTDSDSTDYLEPPSPRVPPLPIGDVPSDGTLSSSDGELDEEKPQSLKCPQLKKRGANVRGRGKREIPLETSRFGKKKNSGWSVTVAGTVELSRSAPDLEMRLSFPANGPPPVVCQSDSGFADDSNHSKLSESLQDLNFYTSRRELPLGSGDMRQKWMLTVKNPKQAGSAPDLGRLSGDSSHRLPDLESSRNRNAKCPDPTRSLRLAIPGSSRGSFVSSSGGRAKRVVEQKMRAIWSEAQKVIRQEFLTESGRLIPELEDGPEDDVSLSVRGSAVSLERKEKPPTMTERDVTRRRSSRTDA